MNRPVEGNTPVELLATVSGAETVTTPIIPEVSEPVVDGAGEFDLNTEGLVADIGTQFGGSPDVGAVAKSRFASLGEYFKGFRDDFGCKEAAVLSGALIAGTAIIYVAATYKANNMGSDSTRDNPAEAGAGVASHSEKGPVVVDTLSTSTTTTLEEETTTSLQAATTTRLAPTTASRSATSVAVAPTTAAKPKTTQSTINVPPPPHSEPTVMITTTTATQTPGIIRH